VTFVILNLIRSEILLRRARVGGIKGLYRSLSSFRREFADMKYRQTGSGFLSSFNLDAPICGRCMQIAKSLDSITDYENVCSRCGKKGVIYSKKMCHSCYFGLIKNNQTSI
jgi:hypothetical protein